MVPALSLTDTSIEIDRLNVHLNMLRSGWYLITIK